MNLASRSRMAGARNGGGPVAEVHDEVAGLLRGQGAVRAERSRRMCARRVATSMTNSTLSPLRKIVWNVEEFAGH